MKLPGSLRLAHLLVILLALDGKLALHGLAIVLDGGGSSALGDGLAEMGLLQLLVDVHVLIGNISEEDKYKSKSDVDYLHAILSHFIGGKDIL